jgi:hypothetical protein
MAGNRLATGNKNRTGLVQRQYRFDIPNIEGAFERSESLVAWTRALVRLEHGQRRRPHPSPSAISTMGVL